ncbi:MAG: PKD domain-containing protein [Planctomycetes bacterium]|nr:PKD domain-containing protein [Planctomycetota bacterium]
MTLASSANDWRNGSYSTTLASNLVAPQYFYGGPKDVPAEASTSSPAPFRLVFSNPTGFFYDPALGEDFVIVVRTPLAPSGTGSFLVDAQGAGGLATSYGHTSDPNAAVANASQVERAPVVLLTYRQATGVQVNFDASPRSGRTPLGVNFFDRTWTSSPGISGWAWDFENDGVVDSTQQNPVHVYTTPGTYSVALAVTDPQYGTIRTVKPGFVQVAPGVTVDFDATPRQGRAYLSVSFTDRSATSSAGLSSWAWDFENDGVVDSTQQNPTHVYVQGGAYSVALEVVDPLHGNYRTVKPAFVQVDPPLTADFDATPRQGRAYLAVSFADRSASSGPGISAWAWDFESDGIVDSTQRNPTHLFTAPGAYDVTLAVTDSVFGTAIARKLGFIQVSQGVVDFDASPRRGPRPLQVAFADLSTLVTGQTTWAWDFESDGVVDSTARHPVHVYAVPGAFNVTLEVNDPSYGRLRVVKPNLVHVDSAFYEVDFMASPRVGDPAQEIEFWLRADVSDPAQMAFAWDFESDGIVDSTAEHPRHRYGGPGSYAVTVRVTHPVLGTRTESKSNYVLLGSTIHVDRGAATCPSGNGTLAAPFCSITEALSAARAGDTILVAAGTYTETLSLSRSVQIAGRPGELVVIAPSVTTASCLTVSSGAIVDLRRLRIRGADLPYQFGEGISGIDAQGASVTLASTSMIGGTGGTRFNGNIPEWWYSFPISVSVALGEFQMIDATVEQAGGVGIDASGSLVRIVDSRITGNRGGLHVSGGRLDLRSSEVIGNRVFTWIPSRFWGLRNSRGGGIRIASTPVVAIHGCSIRQNDEILEGGGVLVSGSSRCEILDTIVAGNRALAHGGSPSLAGGIHVRNSNVSLRRATIQGNSADSWPALFATGSDAHLIDSIAVENLPGGLGISGLTSATYSNIEGGMAGVGNLDAPAAFAAPLAGDFRLLPTSPCIDSGHPVDEPLGQDIARLPRLLDGNLDGALRVDMGAHEFGHVELAVNGNATPGGQVTFENTGTSGFAFLRLGGIAPGATLLPPYGMAFLDLASTWPNFHVGVVPNQQIVSVPLQTITPIDLWFQDLAYDPVSLRGNFSNPVYLRVQ